MVISFLLMIPLIVIGEKKKISHLLFVFAVFLTLITQFLLIFTHFNWVALCILLLLYLIAFNFLEANLPSLISKQAKKSMKGTALGVYSSSQFLGIFVGGSLAGILFTLGGTGALFGINSLIAFLWLLIACNFNLKNTFTS